MEVATAGEEIALAKAAVETVAVVKEAARVVVKEAASVVAVRVAARATRQ